MEGKEAAKVVGVGLDVVEISEFETLEWGAHRRFYERCFSPSEIAYCQSQGRPGEHFAARFAAKEATIKALQGLAPAHRQIEIRRASSGSPSVTVWNPEGDAPLAGLEQYSFFLSLTHSPLVAAAVVVVVCAGGG